MRKGTNRTLPPYVLSLRITSYHLLIPLAYTPVFRAFSISRFPFWSQKVHDAEDDTRGLPPDPGGVRRRGAADHGGAAAPAGRGAKDGERGAGKRVRDLGRGRRGYPRPAPRAADGVDDARDAREDRTRPHGAV